LVGSSWCEVFEGEGVGLGEGGISLTLLIFFVVLVLVGDKSVSKGVGKERDLYFFVREYFYVCFSYLGRRFGFKGRVGRSKEISLFIFSFDSEVVGSVLREIVEYDFMVLGEVFTLSYLSIGLSASILYDRGGGSGSIPGNGRLSYLFGSCSYRGYGGGREGGEFLLGGSGDVSGGVGGEDGVEILGRRNESSEDDGVGGGVVLEGGVDEVIYRS
jgi:hypothetical protein